MKAMILAAGLGTRMGNLSQTTPKIFLKVKNKMLIEYHLNALFQAGFKDIIINVSHHKKLIKETLKEGSDYHVNIQYSEETTPLDSGGGIFHALPLLGTDPFLVISGDTFTDYPFAQLRKKINSLAHLVLIDNPLHHLQGDFYLNKKLITPSVGKKLTYSGIGIFDPKLFNHCQDEPFSISKVLVPAIKKQQISGEYYSGIWINVNTPEILASLQ